MQTLKEIEIEDFQVKTIPHFNNIFRVALRLTKNQSEAEDLTTEVYLQARTAFCFYKPEISCRVWLLKILFRKFNRRRQSAFLVGFISVAGINKNRCARSILAQTAA